MSTISRQNYPVFYIPFGEDKLESSFCKILQEDKRAVLNQAQVDQHGIDQKNQQEFDRQKFRILETYPLIRNILEAKFNQFVEDLGMANENGKALHKITSSWLTRLDQGDTIHMHNHNNCEWSGVVYFDDDYTNQPPLMFLNPLRQFTTYLSEVPARGYSADWQRQPESGLILFFPSWLFHGCMQTVSTNKPRRSIAFNIMPVGAYGADDSSMDTSWLSS
jgi:uncharacterized protein (TIGR02466 family)